MYTAYAENDGVEFALKDAANYLPEAKVATAQNAIGSFKFSIYPNHSMYGRLFPFTTLVKVYDMREGGLAFDGRVLDPIPSMDSKGSVCTDVTCESVEGFLKDSRMPYVAERQWSGDASRTGLQGYIDYVLSAHNAKIEPYKRIYRGDVTLRTHETTNGVYKGLQRESAYDALFKKLVGTYGGEMRVRRDNVGLLRLDYSEQLGVVRSTAIELGRNMKSTSSDFEFSSVVTRLTPLGKKLDGSDDRLTVSSVNSGVDYIDDAELIATYGIIEGTETWDDVEEPGNLLRKGREYLASQGKISRPVKVSALDLSLIGMDPDAFHVYDWYRCRNKLTGLDDTLEVVKKTVDLNDPANPSLEFGTISASQSAAIARAKQAAASAEASGEGERTDPIPISWLRENVDLGR